jgi:hypothetical protein
VAPHAIIAETSPLARGAATKWWCPQSPSDVAPHAIRVETSPLARGAATKWWCPQTPSDVAPHARRAKTSTAPLRKPRNSHSKYILFLFISDFLKDGDVSLRMNQPSIKRLVDDEYERFWN